VADGATVEERTSEDRLVIESFLRKRSEETFFPVFKMFCERILRFFLLHGLDIQSAEDLSQEVFLKVYRKAGELRDPERFLGWMYAIARNELTSHWRQKKSRITEMQLNTVMAEMCDTLLVESDATLKLRLKEWLDQLEQSERDLLILRFVDGLSYKELADALKIPLGTVKWRIFELRRKLAPMIEPSNSSSEVEGQSEQLFAAWETSL
jgi:RNA polymerase sigma-70 factor (ECF subfamily)